MNLERLIDNFAKRLERFDPVFTSSNKTGLNYWKGKPIIPSEEWIEIRNTAHALKYFPDDFDQDLTYIPEDKIGLGRENITEWGSDYLELMEHVKNPNYGRLECFHCLLSPDGDDPIFVGINRLVAKSLNNGTQRRNGMQYPCQVVNRFQCPYERTNTKRNDDHEPINSKFNVEDLFKLQKIAFAVEISLAKARKEDSRIRVRNKEELRLALTDKKSLARILEQGTEAGEVGEYIRTYLAENHDYILDYFMNLRDKVNMEELRFY